MNNQLRRIAFAAPLLEYLLCPLLGIAVEAHVLAMRGDVTASIILDTRSNGLDTGDFPALNGLQGTTIGNQRDAEENGQRLVAVPEEFARKSMDSPTL